MPLGKLSHISDFDKYFFKSEKLGAVELCLVLIMLLILTAVRLCLSATK